MRAVVLAIVLAALGPALARGTSADRRDGSSPGSDAFTSDGASVPDAFSLTDVGSPVDPFSLTDIGSERDAFASTGGRRVLDVPRRVRGFRRRGGAGGARASTESCGTTPLFGFRFGGGDDLGAGGGGYSGSAGHGGGSPGAGGGGSYAASPSSRSARATGTAT